MRGAKAQIFCYIMCFAVLCAGGLRNGREFDLSPDLPSHLPSPPKAEAAAPPTNPGGGAGGGGGQTGQVGGLLQGTPPVPPPQNVPVGPGGPVGPGILPGELVPFGLNHIILIIVPQFKAKYHKLPEWIESSIKISMPVTVFFDQLEVPPGMLYPTPAGLFPVPVGATPSILNPGMPLAPTLPTALQPPLTVGSLSPTYAYYRRRPTLQGNEHQNPKLEQDDLEELDDDIYYTEDANSVEERSQKWNTTSTRTEYMNPANMGAVQETRELLNYPRMKRSVPYNKTIHRTERATIFPKLENILSNAGLRGKHCLLRTVCEVHEAPLNHYGLMGELITLLFSVSRSSFAESHLPEYLQAEEHGKAGNCSYFHPECATSFFSWQETFI